MKGPIGLGIGFYGETVHKYLIMIKDSGIIPFIDFLEYLGQIALIQYERKNNLQNSHPIFKDEYFLTY